VLLDKYMYNNNSRKIQYDKAGVILLWTDPQSHFVLLDFL